MAASDNPFDDVVEVWTRSREQARMRDHSHWRGVGRFANDERWLSIGRGTLAQLRGLLRLVGRDDASLRATAVLEWGPGGGSNMVALSALADVYYGVDISAPNLAECKRQADQIGFHGFRPALLEGPPRDIAQWVDRPIDVFISTAVFQHFLSKEYGFEVLDCVAECLSPRAVGVLQIRYDNGNPKYRPWEGDYARGYLTATSYTLDEFWTALTERGLKPQGITRLAPANNYATYLFTKGD